MCDSGCRSRKAGYYRSFGKAWYNQPKKPPLPELKKINWQKEPLIQPHMNITNQLRSLTIRGLANYKEVDTKDYAALNAAGLEKDKQEPEIKVRMNKSATCRSGWNHSQPVIGCSYLLHMLKHNKPPFNFDITRKASCSRFKPLAQNPIYMRTLVENMGTSHGSEKNFRDE